MKQFRYIAILFLLGLGPSCVEDYQFDVPTDATGISVEGSISNLSYNDMLALPMQPRYFELKLRRVSRVTNVRDEPVLGARIELRSSANEFYDYAEIGEGKYGLFYEDFKALPDREYSILIELSNGVTAESNMEVLPNPVSTGELSFEELSKPVYQNLDGELTIIEKPGINMQLKTLPNQYDSPVYYRWDYTSTYIINSPLAPEGSPVKYCWVTSQYYLQEYELLEDANGDSPATLFFLPTHGSPYNEGFSVMIRQSILSQRYFQYVKDIKAQQEQSELFAKPPYNLDSNLKSEGINVYGFFTVINEEFKRWYFDKNEISNYGGFEPICYLDAPPPIPEYCFNCLRLVVDGSVVNQRPWWWNPPN